MQVFSLPGKYKWVLLLSLMVFVAFMILGAGLAFWPTELNSDPNANDTGARIIGVVCILLFGALAILSVVTLRRLPYTAITADDDGIWYQHVGKADGLVAWSQLASLKERSFRQCLDVYDAQGQRCFQIEYQLEGFDYLRAMLHEKIDFTRSGITRTQFEKSRLYHVLHISYLAGFTMLGIFVGMNGEPLWGYGGMTLVVAMGLYEYAFNATRVRILEEGVEVSYPVSRRQIPYADIENVEMAEQVVEGHRRMGVMLKTRHAKKPYYLKRLGADPHELYAALKMAWSNKKQETDPI